MALNDLVANLRLNTKQFTRQMQQVSKQVSDLGRQFNANLGSGAANALGLTSRSVQQLNNSFKETSRIVGGIIISQVFYGATREIREATSALFDFMGQMERAEISFKYFLGDAQDASLFMLNLKDLAATTALDTAGAINAAQRMLNVGFHPNEVRDIITILHDAATVAGSTQAEFDRVVYAMTQIMSSDKLIMQDLRQLANANIPIFKILREELQLTAEQVANIGDQNIDPVTGITAILRGLQKFSAGASQEFAMTMPGMLETIKDDALILGEALFAGPYESMKNFVANVRNTLEEARDILSGYEDEMGNWVPGKGIGGVFEHFVPPELHEDIRRIIAGFKSLAESAKILMEAFKPVAALVGQTLVGALSLVLPPIAGIVRFLAQVTRAALEASPVLRFLAAAIASLLVARAAAQALLFLWTVMRLGVIAKAIGEAVLFLAGAIRVLSMVLSKGWIGVILAAAAALIYFATSAGFATGWIDKFKNKINELVGIDTSGILEPIDTSDWEDDMRKFQEAFGTNPMEGLNDGLKEVEDNAKKAGKAVNDKFVASFDEVFRVPEKLDDISDKLGDIGLDELTDWGIPDLDFSIPEVPRIEIPDPPLPGGDWPFIPPPEKVQPPKVEVPVVQVPDPLVVKVRQPAPVSVPVAQKPNPFVVDVRVPEIPPIPIPVIPPILIPVGITPPTIMPLLQPVIEDLRRFVTDWELRWLTLPGVVGGIIPGVRLGFERLVDIVGQFGIEFEKGFSRLVDVVGEFGIDFARGFSRLIDTVGQFGIEFEKGFSRLVDTVGQFGIDFAKGFSRLVDTVGEFGIDIAKGFSRLLDTVGDFGIGWDAAWQGIVKIASSAATVLSSGLTGMVDTVKGKLTEIVSSWELSWLDVTTLTEKLAGAIAFILRINADEWLKNLRDALGNIELDFSTVSSSISTLWEIFTTGLSVTWEMVWENLKTNAKEGLKKLKKFWEDHKTEILIVVGLLIAGIVAYFVGLPGSIIAALAGLASRLRPIFAGIGPMVWNAIKGIPSLFTNAVRNFPTIAQRFIDGALRFFREAPGKIGDWLRRLPTVMTQAVRELPSIASTAVNNIVRFFKELPGKIWDAIKSIPSTVASVFSNIRLPSFSAVASGIKATFKPIGPITGFAQGGIIDKDSIIRVGEGGRREAIVPLDNYTAMAPYADAVAARILDNISAQGSLVQQQQQQDNRPILYVGTLIADDRSLRELERRMRVIRADERARGVDR